MQPDRSMVNNKAVAGIAAKELGQFFRAPIAWLFLAAFLLVTLFVFFWVEAFFSRNIADVRPLFEWMPLLLIFLSAALTMKMWSEERRSGTLEHVLTQPVPLWQFVIGKFLACWTLLAIALALTLPLPITVSLLGHLDWGPVFTGYLAALLLGGAYLSIGLFVSARCDNQIVSLILSVALASVFYIIGSSLLTGFLGNQTAEALRSVGTGSRFQSITRGVLDFRDLYYYISLTVAFIMLNILALERGRWAKEGDRRHHSLWRWGTALLIVNALAANFWLGQINALRWDTTRGSIYSISDATRNYMAQLQEPLLIRGYFSEKTHPLLSPLVPQMQDLLREYEIAGKGRVRVEIVDPTTDPELEDEAKNVYNIQSTPFRVSDRHQAALVNSYFNILVKYGDQHEVLGFNELIEVKSANDTSMDVLLRNPEYDITRAIKKTLYAYQSGGNIFDTVESPLTLTAYISADTRLPPELVELRKAIEKEAEEMKAKADGKFDVKFVDPDANGGAEGRRITEEYGFAPMAAGLMDPEHFFFYVMLGREGQLMQVPLGDYTAGAFKQSLAAGVKRFGKGFTRSIALVKPKPAIDPMTPPQIHDASMERFGALRQILADDANIIDEDLADGRIDPAADVLILVSPRLTTDKERFAVDQFLMRGGTVIATTSPYSASLERTSMALKPHDSGLSSWLEDIGISIGKELVLDRRNSAFPVPVTRQVNGMSFQDLQLLDYPYFVDIRPDGLNQDVLVTAQLPQVTVPWASPIRIDEEKSKGFDVIPLLYSSEESWLSEDINITPDLDQVRSGFTTGENPQRHLLAVSIQGRFPSQFAGKDSPLLSQPEAGDTAAGNEENAGASKPADINVVLNHSAESARLILFSSNDIFRDEIVSMLGATQGSAYLNSLQLAVNSVDWSLEDQGLLSIRARGHFNRTLDPMESGRQQFWEYLNYAIVLLALGVLWLVYRSMTRARHSRYQRMLAA